MRKFILGFLIFAGCSKTKDSTTTITILETATNLPVSGADVTISTCDSNCTSGGTLLFHGFTDANGICEVPTKHFDAAWMDIQKAGYRTVMSFGLTTVFLTPIGNIQVRIHQVNSYPAGSDIQLVTTGEFGMYGSGITF